MKLPMDGKPDNSNHSMSIILPLGDSGGGSGSGSGSGATASSISLRPSRTTIVKAWFRRNILAIVGAIIVGLLLVTAVAGPVIAPFPADYLDLNRQLAPPDQTHLMGTDENGGDVLTGIIHGARVAVIVGLSTVLVCLIIGVSLGAISGYFGGFVDDLIMRLADIVMAFPGILLAILIIFVTQRPSLSSVVFALSVTGWASYARLVRGQVLSLREREFILASKVLGASSFRILIRHVIPNVMAPVVVQATFGMASAILAEASLSFLGLGPQGTPSWGALLDQGSRYFLVSSHLATFPGVAIMLSVLGINFLGDSLRDRLDPKRSDAV